MFDALQIAATGMHAQQMNVETVANNLANVNTIGFKKVRIGFFELVAAASGTSANADAAPAPPYGMAATGTGVGISSLVKSFDQGEVRKTDAPMDILIEGNGFLEVAMSDGTRAYSRGGTLKVNAEGILTDQTGNTLKPGIAVPVNSGPLVISADGKVSAKVSNQGEPIELGRFELVRFTNAGALDALGDGLYKSNESTGEAIAGRSGEDGMGTIRQGQLESSNVKLVEEMISLMLAQRAYEASVKVAQASDEMLGLINNLRK